MRISGLRAGVVGVLAVVVTTLVVVAGVALRGGVPAVPERPRPGPVVRGVARAAGALAVLRAFEHARARAWAHGDSAALAALYVPGSSAGARDVAMLRAWAARGLRVVGLEVQVLAVVLRVRAAGRLVLVVTDRVAGATVRGAGWPDAVPGGRALPRDGPTTRRLVFRRVAGRWLLASAQPRASPVASTASTSGSANS